ncbi:hypothetical protein LTR27_001865 [Elasticomyces elasticus]|nr:hypothetical protein LTR27_001865 [Elasticomyces elasticus]
MASVGDSLDDSGIDLSFDKPIGDAPSSSAPVPASGAYNFTPSTPEQYRFPWGKHKGKLLSELTPEYLQWLMTECDAYNQNQRMQSEVQSFLASSSQSSLATPAQYTPVSRDTWPSSQPVGIHSQTSIESPPTPYTLTFGKYAGKRVDEVPPYYVSWLKNSCVAYRTNSRSRDAVDTALASMPTPPRLTVSSQLVRTPSQTFASSQDSSETPSGSQATRRPLQPISGLHSTQSVAASLEFPTPLQAFTPSQAVGLPMASQENQDPNEYVLRFGKHAGKKLVDVPLEYVDWLKNGEYIKNNAKLVAAWDKIPRVYRLSFGAHKGCTLDEVPPTYLNWLQTSDHADEGLRQALTEWEASKPAAVPSNVTATGRIRQKPFQVPSDRTDDVRRFYYNAEHKNGQMWIGPADCVEYFGADRNALTKAGLRPHENGSRFWVHQVFECATYYETTVGKTPFKALQEWKAKKYGDTSWVSTGKKAVRVAPKVSRPSRSSRVSTTSFKSTVRGRDNSYAKYLRRELAGMY